MKAMGLLSTIFLEELDNGFSLVRGNVGAHSHVEHDGFPLSRRSLGRVAFGVAAVTIDRVEVRARELGLLFGLGRSFFGFLVRFGIRSGKGAQRRPVKESGEGRKASGRGPGHFK